MKHSIFRKIGKGGIIYSLFTAFLGLFFTFFWLVCGLIAIAFGVAGLTEFPSTVDAFYEMMRSSFTLKALGYSFIAFVLGVAGFLLSVMLWMTGFLLDENKDVR